jgi:hypothetical protein
MITWKSPNLASRAMGERGSQLFRVSNVLGLSATYWWHTARPLSFFSNLAERSSPARVHCVAQDQRALACSGPFRRLCLI